MAEEPSNDGTVSRRKPNLSVNTSGSDGSKQVAGTPHTLNSTPCGSSTPVGVRGSSDLRSPGADKSPTHASGGAPVPDFITQTDRYGNASTPRSAAALAEARKQDPNGGADGNSGKDHLDVDPCETLLDSIRLMCCCLLTDENPAVASKEAKPQASEQTDAPSPTFTVTEDKEEVRVKLLSPHHPDDVGKKCLVLDLDETLVHSSFRAVPAADFVIPVQVRFYSTDPYAFELFLSYRLNPPVKQIEDVVHFVYVAKRPGVDEFLIEMAKHYELVIYTASLNKYADPLLDLLDPQRVIRARLFRESCVYYEGNYVKDMSLIDRDLSQSIIVDNSPSSYIFHPENAIDCSSFIDDPADRELDQIAAFLIGIKDAKDVRNLAPQWRDWPKVRGLENKSPVPED
jgi:carboxy-terminal domain RNA polymerase II polypeptide A small phosphatase